MHDIQWVSVSWSQRTLKYEDYTLSQLKYSYRLKEQWWIAAFQINWQY